MCVCVFVSHQHNANPHTNPNPNHSWCAASAPPASCSASRSTPPTRGTCATPAPTAPATRWPRRVLYKLDKYKQLYFCIRIYIQKCACSPTNNPPPQNKTQPQQGIGRWVVQFAYFFLLCGNFIPVSLYVSMSTVRFFQSYFMEWDLHMYHAGTDHHAEVKIFIYILFICVCVWVCACVLMFWGMCVSPSRHTHAHWHVDAHTRRLPHHHPPKHFSKFLSTHSK